MATTDHTSMPAPRGTISAWLGIVLLFSVFGLFVWAVIGASPRSDTYEEKRAKARTEKLKTARGESDAALTTYGYVDKAKGVVHVPIARAMELAMADLAQKKPAPANPIATPAAPAAVAQSGAGAPPSPPVPAPPAGTNAPKPTTVKGADSEIHNQPAAAANPSNAQPGTQPGPNATPAASPPSQATQANLAPSPSTTPAQNPAGSPLPVRGATP